MKNHITKYRGAYVLIGLLLANTAHAFDMGNIMNPSKWMGSNKDDDYYDHRGYGYGGPGWGYPGYGYGAPGWGGYPGYGYGAPGWGGEFEVADATDQQGNNRGASADRRRFQHRVNLSGAVPVTD